MSGQSYWIIIMMIILFLTVKRIILLPNRLKIWTRELCVTFYLVQKFSHSAERA